MAFKRASLNGSAQLFEPTRVPQRERRVPPEQVDHPRSDPREASPTDPEARSRSREPSLVSEISGVPLAHGHLYRLSDDDVESLLAALQHAKFPHSYQRLPKPQLEEFEQLEALRQKITDQREARG
jgi:hypothetical protein